MSDTTKTLISGTVRTLAQLVPIAGGAVAQAWSEYDSHVQNKRTETFFEELAAHLKKLQSEVTDMRSKILDMPDAAELLERAVAASKRETNDLKRQVYSRLYSSFLASPKDTTPDERLDLLHHIEQLTHADLQLLRRFISQHEGLMRGDMITNSVDPGWSRVGDRTQDHSWLDQHGATVHSIAKLEARGLIMESTMNAGFAYSGESGSPFNIFRQKAWRITPIGVKLFRALNGHRGK